MGRYTISGDEELAVFVQRFVPKGCSARLPEAHEDPTILPRDGEIGIYPVLFEQAGLRLPLDRLLCDVLRRCNMALCQLAPNGVRVVLGCSALNKRLGVRLTWREIFYCYSLCHCPQDHSRYYFRARIGAPDLVKGLTKSETGYDEGMIVIGGSWDDGDIVKIKRSVQSHVVTPKRPSKNVIDWDSINPVINYNGVRGCRILDHPRAVHTLLGYNPWDTDFLKERANQPDWLGPSKRPSKLEDRQKVRLPPPARPVIHTALVIREGPVENAGVTATGQFAQLRGPAAVDLGDRGKKKVVEPSQESSDTPTDPELVHLQRDIESAGYRDLEDTATMAPRRRTLGQAMTARNEAGAAGPSEGVQGAPARKRPRYGRNAVVVSPSVSPPAEVEVEVSVPQEDDALVAQGDANPELVTEAPATEVGQGELDPEWRPTFSYQGRALRESDSLYKSASVAATIMYGITKADDVSELKDIPNLPLRNKALQDILKAAQAFMVLDDRRAVASRDQARAIKDLDEEKNTVVGQLKKKKKELDTANNLISGLNQQLGHAQGEVTMLRTEVERLRGENAEVARLKKEMSDLLAKRKVELDDAEQKGYDICFEQSLAELDSIRGRLYQAGYDRGLDAMAAPPESDLRVQVSIPADFQYEVGTTDLVEDGAEAPTPVAEDLVDTDRVATVQEGAEVAAGEDVVEVAGGGDAVEGALEDTGTHDPSIQID